MIAAVAAVTAGLLTVAGVGDGESRDGRVNRAAERLAVDFVRQDPEFCDSLDQYLFEIIQSNELVLGTGGFIEVDPATRAGSYLSGLSDAEITEVFDRFLGELQAQCEERGR